ncbi:hypothetical protein BGW80DRAFT_383169 [Lactifluus volemus]|nr:hypothetical protein BGW80DRAFT_383169 [Lactifluus volemus]
MVHILQPNVAVQSQWISMYINSLSVDELTAVVGFCQPCATFSICFNHSSPCAGGVQRRNFLKGCVFSKLSSQGSGSLGLFGGEEMEVGEIVRNSRAVRRVIQHGWHPRDLDRIGDSAERKGVWRVVWAGVVVTRDVRIAWQHPRAQVSEGGGGGWQPRL